MQQSTVENPTSLSSNSLLTFLERGSVSVGDPWLDQCTMRQSKTIAPMEYDTVEAIQIIISEQNMCDWRHPLPDCSFRNQSHSLIPQWSEPRITRWIKGPHRQRSCTVRPIMVKTAVGWRSSPPKTVRRRNRYIAGILEKVVMSGDDAVVFLEEPTPGTGFLMTLMNLFSEQTLNYRSIFSFTSVIVKLIPLLSCRVVTSLSKWNLPYN